MNLSIQHNVMTKNANYISIPKNSFKGTFLTKEAFAAESKIIEQINNLPKNVFLEFAEFVKFCKSIVITPKINGVLKKRLVEVRQANINSKSFIA